MLLKKSYSGKHLSLLKKSHQKLFFAL